MLIGHGIRNDLNCLGMIYPRIVGSTILAAEAFFQTQMGNSAVSEDLVIEDYAKDCFRKVYSGWPE